MNNTLATLKNMVMWGKATIDTCLACKENSQSLLHVVSGCKVHLQQGRYTWRHNSILATLLRSIDGMRNLKVFADIPGYPCPTVVTGTLKRPDIIIVLLRKDCTRSRVNLWFCNQREREFRKENGKIQLYHH